MALVSLLIMGSSIGYSLTIEPFEKIHIQESEPFEGYTLFGPMWGSNTYLIDMKEMLCLHGRVFIPILKDFIYLKMAI